MDIPERKTLDPLDQLEQMNLDLRERLDELTNGCLKGEISPAQHRMLLTASQYGPLSIGELARHAGSAISTTSELMARLMKHRLVAKIRGPYDGRLVMVELTPEGQQILRHRRERARDRFQQLQSRLSSSERSLFLSAMKQLVELLGKGEDGSRRQEPKSSDSKTSTQEATRSAPPIARVAVSRQGDSTAVRIFSVGRVAEMCRVSPETIRRWIRKHGLKAYNTAAGLAIKIVETDLREFSERLRVFVDWEAVERSTIGARDRPTVF
jgi:excisionase family DNA binding protein